MTSQNFASTRRDRANQEINSALARMDALLRLAREEGVIVDEAHSILRETTLLVEHWLLWAEQ